MDDGKDIVVRLSPPGEDVTRAADYRLAYDYGWYTMSVVHKGLIEAGTPKTDIVYNHNLGFPPVFLVFAQDHFTNISVSQDRSMFYNNNRDQLTVDDSTVAFSGTGNTEQDLYYYLFNIDLSKDFRAESLSPGKSSKPVGVNNDIVMKASIDGESAYSDDPQHLSINSDIKGLQVHAVADVEEDDPDNTFGFNTAIYEHGLGYPASYFIYQQIGGSGGAWRFVNSNPEGGIQSATSDTHLYLSSSGYRAVILKDPIFAL